jgi:hypothetical protein
MKESIMQRPLTPSFKVVTEIARHAGNGMTVARFQSLRFPTGACQVWEFTPALPPLDRPPVVVAVFLRQGRPETWTPVADRDYEGALRHYAGLAAATRPAPVTAPPAAASATPLVLPLPRGVRIAAPAGGKPLAIGGQPVAVAAAGGAP